MNDDRPAWQWGAATTAARIRARAISCVDVMEATIARIADVNPRLNAIVYPLFDDARARARAADAALAQGADVGPLHGVPVTIKENADVAGQPTPNGVPAFEKTIAPDDAAVTRLLRRAGAIVIGRTTAPEFSMRATTTSPLHGRTFNPWHPDASAGGSSGGAGAAAAAGMGPLHHGNDIGGSLRFPSFMCGVSTVKPSQGRVPSFNPSAAAERGILAQLMSVQGVIAREVVDVRLGTRVLAGGDPRDPWWVPAPFDGPPLDGPIRVAVTRNPHGYPIDPRIGALVDRAAEVLAAAGYRVEAVEPPPIAEPARGWMTIALTEMKHTLDPNIRKFGSEEIGRIFDGYYRFGEVQSDAAYLQGIAARTRMTRQWSVFLDTYPLVLCPFLMRPGYAHDIDARSYEGLADLFGSALYSYGINYLGLPAGVQPTGMIDGLPAAVQIVGRRLREDTILDAMTVLERDAGVFAHALWARDTNTVANRA